MQSGWVDKSGEAPGKYQNTQEASLSSSKTRSDTLCLANTIGPCPIIREFVNRKRPIQRLHLGVKLALWWGGVNVSVGGSAKKS